MTEKEITLVQDSFQKVVPIASTAAEIFYGKLFEKDPSLKPLFKGNMEDQGKKLMSMIGAAVNGLNNLEALVPVVEDLGKKHKGYAVPESSYATVGASLIETLQAGLGEDFTEETKDAWIKVYTILSDVMIKASEY